MIKVTLRDVSFCGYNHFMVTTNVGGYVGTISVTSSPAEELELRQNVYKLMVREYGEDVEYDLDVQA